MLLIRKDHSELLRKLTASYDVPNILFVDDFASWADQKRVQLGEPHQVMKIVHEPANGRVLVVQAEANEGLLNDVIKAIKIRWTLRDNIADTDRIFNSVKKQLAYCFLKECARSLDGVGGDELVEDEWVLEEMKKQGFFRE
ncbi:MAG: hypothetical protein A2X56_10975 [Nitrospirae bacterium GWC2_57_13]|nr:MAG: hypothetical protein A2X56_10975 [Nitrospirae bacterium GWC2_57_13]OGW41913.1 MAG: hypothetical protein A2X57_09740 [Nitrospirae bacterium GWD2_57_8]HAS54025.1 hypothetical protein [Nitrospiraceae bacterium]